MLNSLSPVLPIGDTLMNKTEKLMEFFSAGMWHSVATLSLWSQMLWVQPCDLVVVIQLIHTLVSST